VSDLGRNGTAFAECAHFRVGSGPVRKISNSVLTRKADELKSGSSTALTACLGGLALFWYFFRGFGLGSEPGFVLGRVFCCLLGHRCDAAL
jgi:hypothetical protein